MKKILQLSRHYIVIVSVCITAIIIVNITNYVTKDKSGDNIYYIDYTIEDGSISSYSIIKYNTSIEKKEKLYVQKDSLTNIHDVYDVNQMIINGNFGESEKEQYTQAEYINGELVNLNEIFDTYNCPVKYKYIKDTSDIACWKKNDVLIYHRDTEEVEEVLNLDDTQKLYGSRFSYDGTIFYYVCDGVLYSYSLIDRTTTMLQENVYDVDITADGNILYYSGNNNILYKKDLITDEVEEITFKKDIQYFDLTGDGENVIFGNLYIYNTKTKRTRCINRSIYIWDVESYKINKDGTKVLYIKYDVEPTFVRYYIYDIKTEKKEKVLTIPDGLPWVAWCE